MRPDTPLPIELVPMPADAPDLTEIADRTPERTDDTPATRWTITDNGSAEWAMAQYATAAATVAALEAQRTEWLRLVAEWFKSSATPAQRTMDFFRYHLEGYAIDVRESSPRDKKGEPTIKTLQLVTGKVSTRGKAETVDVSFEADVIEWAKATVVPLDESAALLGGWVTDVDGTFTVNVGTWVDHTGATKYLVPLAELGVVKVKESIDIAQLRRWVTITDRNVAPDGADEPLIVRAAVGPDGDAVPGVVVTPPEATATVSPAV